MTCISIDNIMHTDAIEVGALPAQAGLRKGLSLRASACLGAPGDGGALFQDQSRAGGKGKLRAMAARVGVNLNPMRTSAESVIIVVLAIAITPAPRPSPSTSSRLIETTLERGYPLTTATISANSERDMPISPPTFRT